MQDRIAKYLANEMEAQERLDFEALVPKDASLQDELYIQIGILNASDPSSSAFDSKDAFQKIESKIEGKELTISPKTNFSFLKIAATLLIVLTAGFFMARSLSDQSQEDFLTYETSDQIDAFELPDGTSVRLNANSRLILDNGFAKDNRQLTLSGAANFEVAKNEDLPFVINANNGSVKVVGTVFEVNAYPKEDVELNVAEGKVTFASKTTAAQDVFVAGDRGLLTSDGKELIKTTRKNENYGAWWTKRLVFEEQVMSEAVSDLEKEYHVDIDFDDALSACQWSAILENYTLTEVLETLKTTYPNISKIEIKDSQIKLEGKACND